MYRKNKNSNSDGRPLSERAVEKFADMMVKRMEEMQKSHWKQGWTDGAANFGMPRNIVSGTLNNSNAFFLMLHTSMSGFTMPVYMTFKQAKNLGLKISKGAEAVPVVYWNKTYKDKDGKPIDRETYVNMTDEEREVQGVIVPEGLSRVQRGSDEPERGQAGEVCQAACLLQVPGGEG